MRLYKYLKAFGGFTKSEIKTLQNQKLIYVNGEIKGFLYEIKNDDEVIVDNKIIKSIQFSYFAYYKPKGILSDISDKFNSYINYLPVDYKLMPAGRLDKESEGLMILTNDGDFINEIMSPNNHKKEYIVTLKNKITDDFIENLKKSYVLKNRITTPFIVNIIDDYTINLILHEGIYHQIRKIISLNNNCVLNLKRIRIGNLKINDLNPGEFKEIKKNDVIK